MPQKDFLISNTSMTYSCFLGPANLGPSVHYLVPVWLLFGHTLLPKLRENKYWNKQQKKARSILWAEASHWKVKWASELRQRSRQDPEVQTKEQ